MASSRVAGLSAPAHGVHAKRPQARAWQPQIHPLESRQDRPREEWRKTAGRQIQRRIRSGKPRSDRAQVQAYPLRSARLPTPGTQHEIRAQWLDFLQNFDHG
jgi:hypothetical protein